MAGGDHEWTEAEAIEIYDRAGRVSGSFASVRWPDIAITETNLRALVEGVVTARVDVAREAFGHDLDTDALADRLEQACRHDAMQVRFAPEGVFVRARCEVRVWLLGDEGEEDEEETLTVEGELCLSFSTRRHARPYVDFMGGRLVRASDGAARGIDPFGMMIEPQIAVAWGLNGASR